MPPLNSEKNPKYRQLEGEYDFDEDPGSVLAELDDRNNMVVRFEAC